MGRRRGSEKGRTSLTLALLTLQSWLHQPRGRTQGAPSTLCHCGPFRSPLLSDAGGQPLSLLAPLAPAAQVRTWRRPQPAWPPATAAPRAKVS